MLIFVISYIIFINMSQKYNKTLYTNKLTEEEYKCILNFLYKSSNSLITSNATFDRFIIDQTTISIYKTKKIVIQGNNVVNTCIKLNLPYVKYDKQQDDENKVKLSSYIGCDEVGVGDYFGGIVCCATYVDEAITKKLKALHVDDSKKISDAKILTLGIKLKKICPNVVCVIAPNKFNKLYDKYNNVHIIKTYGHNECITKLKTKVGINTPVYMDQYCSKDNYLKYLNKLGIIYLSINKIDVFETKSESKYIAIAAASIIARYEFIKMINKLENKLHEYKSLESIVIPYGASNKIKINETINEIANVLGDDKLVCFTKTCFKR